MEINPQHDHNVVNYVMADRDPAAHLTLILGTEQVLKVFHNCNTDNVSILFDGLTVMMSREGFQRFAAEMSEVSAHMAGGQ